MAEVESREEIAEAKRDLGRRLAAARKRAAWTQKVLGRKARYSRSAIANAEAGTASPARGFWADCDRLLGCGGELLGAYDRLQELKATHRQQAVQERERQRYGGEDESHFTCGPEAWLSPVAAASPEKKPESDPKPLGGLVDATPIVGMLEVSPVVAGTPAGMSRRGLLAGIAAVATSCGLVGNQGQARQLGASDVARISAVTNLYRSVDYEYGGGELYVEVGNFAESVSGLLDWRFSETLAPRLLRAVAAARQLAGWTAFDSCRHSDGQRHFLAAERAAVAAGDVLLAARVRYCQARQYQHLRHNRDALASLRLARDHLGGRATATVGAMLDGAEAASLAALGDHRQALMLVGRAEDGYNKGEREREPDWMQFYDHGELLAQYGRVYRDRARTDPRQGGPEAVKFTEKAIDAFNPQSTRSSVLNTVGLCSALFLADQPEQALAVGARAIAQAGELASPRIVDRLRNVRHDMARHRRIPEVAEFAHTLAALDRGTNS